ncbi:PAS domain-containing protein [Agrobacterium rosae]|uniref:PAS domain-containing protein n=1 Tax=Agrobacterium rosae TaxID=1972867 RepID=UPI0019D3B8B4|nr:PAS domain-containing protein [Agrobacterium rosae]MBN7808062.1 PAS domain-containing protein [Agrobacterium rosae]
MKTNASLEIYSYWNEIRGDRPAPLRGEIDPSQIRHVLPDLFVLTDLGDDAPVFRLTGTRLYNLFCRELRDTPFSMMWQPEAAYEACRIANGVFQHERPVIFDLWSESVSGHTAQEFEMLLLPLEAETHFPSRLLGALVSDPPLADFGQPFKPLELTRSRLLEAPASHTFVEPAAFDSAINRSVFL